MRPISAAFAVALLAILPACRDQAPEKPARPVTRWSAVEDLVRQKDYAGAYAALEAMRVEGKPDVDLLVRLAEVKRLQGDVAKAILHLREAAAADPASASVVERLAALYSSVGEYAKTRELIEAARAKGTNTIELAMLLGQSLGQQKEFEAALREFEAARALGAQPPVVLYNRALVLGQMQRNAEAVQALEEVVKTASGHLVLAGKRELARALLDGKPTDPAVVERALDLLVSVQPELPEDWRVQESIGDAWMLRGDWDAAILSYTEALRLGKNPKSVEDRYRMAVTRKRERDSAGVPPPPAPKDP